MKIIKHPYREEFVFIRVNETFGEFRATLRNVLRKCVTNFIIIHLENFDHNIMYHLKCKSDQFKRNFVIVKFLIVPINFFT